MKKYFTILICILSLVVFYVVGRPAEDRHKVAVTVKEHVTVDIALQEDETIIYGPNSTTKVIPAGTMVNVGGAGSDAFIYNYEMAKFEETPDYIIEALEQKKAIVEANHQAARAEYEKEEKEYKSHINVWFVHSNTLGRIGYAIASAVIYLAAMLFSLKLAKTKKDYVIVAIVAIAVVVILPIGIYFYNMTYLCR